MDATELTEWLQGELTEIIRGLYTGFADNLDKAADEARRAGNEATLTGVYAHPPEWFRGYEDGCRAMAGACRLLAETTNPIRGNADVVPLHKGEN